MMRRFLFLLVMVPRLAGAWDHLYTNYDSLLSQFVADGQVDYQGLQDQPDRLLTFISQTEFVTREQFDSTFNRAQKLAFLINLYNAYILQLIMDNYPIKSIRDLQKPWERKIISLFGRRLSLNDIEHDLIRKEFKEPRIHFALVGAAKSSPVLQEWAYIGDNLDQQLALAAREFLTDGSRNNIEPGPTNTIRISMLFKWHEKKFIRTRKSLVKVIEELSGRRFEKPPQIKYLDYDWGLNARE